MSDPSSEQRLTDAEWILRYDARIRVVAGYQGSYSIDTDCTTQEAIADLRDSFENDPEGAADEEMSYWEDDGDTA